MSLASLKSKQDICAKAHSGYGILLMLKSKFNQAEEQYSQAQSLLSEEDGFAAEIWANRALNFTFLNHFDAAELYTKKAIDFFENSDSYLQYTAELVALYNNQGLFLRKLGKREAAQQSFLDAIDLDENPNSENYATKLFNLAVEYYVLFDYQESEQTAKEAIKILENLNKSTGVYGLLHGLLGQIEHRRGNYPAAKKLNQLGLAILRDISAGINSGHADILINVARDQINPDQAETYYKEAISIYLKIFPSSPNERIMKGYQEFGDFP